MHKEVGNIGDTLGHIATLLAQCVQLIVFLSIPIWLNPTLTLTTVALSIVFSAPFFMLSKLSYRLGKLNTSTANNYVAVISETFSSIRLILSFGRQAVTHKKYMNAYQSHVSATLRSQTLNAVVHTLFQPMAMLAVILAISFSLKYEAASISQIAAIMWSLLSAIPLLSGILQGKISISNFLPSYEQLISLKGKAIELKENSG
jgi:ATP-binding cassette subfamily B protein